MKNNFWKGLIMTLVALIASYISEHSGEGLQWQYILITTIGTAIIYIGKNALYQSGSPAGNLDWRDALSGLIVAVGTAISSGAASFIIDGAINWKSLGVAVVAVVVGYFGKTLATNTGQLKKS